MSKSTKTLPQFVVKNQDPENVEAEQAVLGSLLIDRDAFVRIQSVNLAASDFYVERHGWIFAAMNDLFRQGKSVDLITLSDELTRRGQLEEIGGSSHLASLINVVPSSVWVESYAEMVRRYAIQRRLIAYSGAVAQLAYRGELTSDELFGIASQLLLELINHNQVNEPKKAGEVAKDYLKTLEGLMDNPAAIIGIPTGFADLDKLLDGLKRKKLYLLAGQPGIGKSSLALQIGKNLSEANRSVLVLTLEMANAEVMERLFCQVSGKTVREQRDPANYVKMARTTEYIDKLPLWIEDGASSIEVTRNKAISHKFKHGLDLLIVDYTQEMTVTTKSRDVSNRAKEVGYIGRQLKELSRDLDIPVLALSSLSRDGVRGKPTKYHLKESGDLEYAADGTILGWSPDEEFPNVVELIIDKHRGGATGELSLFFQKSRFTFKPLETITRKFEQVA